MSIVSTPASIASDRAERMRAQLAGGRRDLVGAGFVALLVAALLASIGILAVLVLDMVGLGAPVLTDRLSDFLTAGMRSQAETSGIGQGLRGTFFIGVITVLVAFPLGVAAAIYLEEYAPTTSRFARFIDLNIRNLAGVPSVVYGILGFTIFVKALGGLTGPQAQGKSVLSAALTMAVLVLPIVIITASEALRAVPGGLREAGFAVGASRWEVTRHHVLPYAAPGILTGTILALSRALGEAAPLILVGATSGYLTTGDSYALDTLRDRFTAMPTVITTWAGRPGESWAQVTGAAIVALLVVVIAANLTAILLRNRFERRRQA